MPPGPSLKPPLGYSMMNVDADDDDNDEGVCCACEQRVTVNQSVC